MQKYVRHRDQEPQVLGSKGLDALPYCSYPAQYLPARGRYQERAIFQILLILLLSVLLTSLVYRMPLSHGWRCLNSPGSGMSRPCSTSPTIDPLRPSIEESTINRPSLLSTPDLLVNCSHSAFCLLLRDPFSGLVVETRCDSQPFLFFVPRRDPIE